MRSWWEDHLDELDAQLGPWWLTQLAFTVRRTHQAGMLVDITELEQDAAPDDIAAGAETALQP